MPIEDRIRDGLSRNAEVPAPPVEQHLAIVHRRHRRRTAVRFTVAAAVVAVLAAPLWALLTTLGNRDPQPVRPEPPSLPGSYRVAIDGRDSSALRGTWQVTLEADGALTLTPPPSFRGALSTGATYELSGDAFTTNVFVDWPGCQRTDPPVGLYRVRVTKSAAHFIRLHDSCPARAALFQSSWERLP